MLIDYLITWLQASLDLFTLMAPFLLLGFILAGVLHVLVPKEWVARHLGGRGFRASVKAAFVGTPLPLCSCGVIPFAEMLKKQGASRSAITSFLISTPQTGVDSILAAYALLGLPLALWKVLTALVSGIIGGSLVPFLDKSDQREADCRLNGPCGNLPTDIPVETVSCCSSNAAAMAKTDSCCSSTTSAPAQTDSYCASETAPSSDGDSCCSQPVAKTKWGLTRSVITYGFGSLVNDIALWLVVGTLVGGAITAFIPDDLLTTTINNNFLQMMLILVIAIPLYVCATGSIPVAVALILKGMPIGAAIVFLVAGPATNVATLMVFTKVLGRRTVGIYLGTIFVMSLFFGFLFDQVFPGATLPHQQIGHAHEHGAEAIQWWHWASAALLGLLIARYLISRLLRPASQAVSNSEKRATAPKLEQLILQVEGMSCGHCQGRVKKALLAVSGVKTAAVSLKSSRAEISGYNLAEAPVVESVIGAGYSATLVSPPG